MRGRLRLGAIVASAAVAAIGIPIASVSAHSRENNGRHNDRISHVLLISVDGLHQSDLAWYIEHHPGSELAKLAGNGAEFNNARTPIPSDSFPGMVGQVTGGDPATTGVYYDAEYNHNLLPAGTTSCTGKTPGAEVNYFEVIDKNPLSIDAGQGLSGLPDSILKMSGQPLGLIDTAKLPVDPKTCHVVYPHQYLKVNTIFEIAHNHRLLTAWSDKHIAYEILSGRSGTGIDDQFSPEINSNALMPGGTPYPGGIDYTGDNAATMQYDSYKVRAVLNEIDGFDHGRTTKTGVPAIFGMNFQTVSTAQKLPVSDGLNGGYLPGTTTPGPLLSRALGYINAQLQAMVGEIKAQGMSSSTAIILSAKHGQSPQNPSDLTRIDDGAIVDAINAGWKALHPSAGPLVAADPGDTAAGSRDDAFPLWLNDRSHAATEFVKNYLLSHPATGTTYNSANPAKAGPPRTLSSSGLSKVFTGEEAADYFGVSPNDPRHPDVWGVVQHGVVYTGGVKKIAEHGGADPQDRDVALVVYAPGVVDPRTVDWPVETTQIAPTILSLVGLDPSALDAVRIEGTRGLLGS
jgi:Type I phosphodiesterase / nucleotide pyrophosphatase